MNNKIKKDIFERMEKSRNQSAMLQMSNASTKYPEYGDNGNKISEVIYYKNTDDKVKDEFDEKGHVTKTIYSSDCLEPQFYKNEYHDNGSIKLIEQRDKDGNIKKIENCDEKGRLLTCKITDLKGKLIDAEENTYDDENNTILLKNHYEPDRTTLIREFENDEIKVQIYESPMFGTDVVISKPDENTGKIVELLFDLNPYQNAYNQNLNKNVYDKEGNLERTLIYENTKQVLNKYDDKGNLILQDHYNGEELDLSIKKDIAYDENNRPIKEEISKLSIDSNIEKARREWYKDYNGRNLKEQEYFDKFDNDDFAMIPRCID